MFFFVHNFKITVMHIFAKSISILTICTSIFQMTATKQDSLIFDLIECINFIEFVIRIIF